MNESHFCALHRAPLQDGVCSWCAITDRKRVTPPWHLTDEDIVFLRVQRIDPEEPSGRTDRTSP